MNLRFLDALIAVFESGSIAEAAVVLTSLQRASLNRYVCWKVRSASVWSHGPDEVHVLRPRPLQFWNALVGSGTRCAT